MATVKRIISIQSHVLHGHVGNAAAVPAMTALGCKVTAVPTTLLSNHPHYPTMRGQILDTNLVADLLTGIEERGLVEDAAMLVTGYLGSAENGLTVADFVDRAKARNPDLLIVCDPVLGDEDLGLFTDPLLIEVYRERLMPQSWLVTPNRWEAQLLVSADPRGELELLQQLRLTGATNVVVTGGTIQPRPLRTIGLDGGGCWAIETPWLPARAAGTGDYFTGALAGAIMSGESIRAAAERAVTMTHRLLARTSALPWSELPIDDYPAAIEADPRFRAVSLFQAAS